ncbi:MAG TPA: hypothetical protein VHN14_01515 [Kofleriaceae bacterium]|jgi:hypothetical protein|nr:hypothetical protein [Kofleriaceae bacterium]
MKTWSVLMLGWLLSSTAGCALEAAETGDLGNGDEVAEEVVALDGATSSFEMLRGGYGDSDDHDDGGDHDQDHGHGGYGHGGHGHGRRCGAPAVRRAIGQGVARLAALQADTTGDNARNGLDDNDPDDGGWDFTLAPSATSHTAARSPTNLFGAIGLAAWAAVDCRAAGNRALVTALDAGTGMQRNPDVDSPPDFVFGVLLADLADNPGFADLARQRYDAKRASFGGTVGLATRIRDARHGSHQDGLIAYDLGWLTLSAAALDAVFPSAGYDADAHTYAGVVVDDLTSATPRFDLHDTTLGFYITGLAWSQVASAWLDSRSLLRQLRAQLVSQQQADGAWGTNAAHPAADLQATAHALQTLALTGHATVRSRQAEDRAARRLLRAQATSGGWPVSPSLELPLVDADIMLGLMLSRTRAGQDGVVPGAAFAAVAAGDAPVAAPLP